MLVFFIVFIVVPCMLFQSLLYCSNSCTSLHFKTLKSHTKTLRFYMFRSPLKPSSGGPWQYFARLLNWNVDLNGIKSVGMWLYASSFRPSVRPCVCVRARAYVCARVRVCVCVRTYVRTYLSGRDYVMECHVGVFTICKSISLQLYLK
jgi:hypothetical protein